MTGAGTENNPYIVDNWTDFHTINTNSTGIYVRWADAENKAIDFNEINPEGFSEPVKFPANVDFNGWKFKNLRINSGGIVSKNIQNIIIEDFIFSSSEYGFSSAVTNTYGTMENCVISGNIQCENTVSFLENVSAQNCAFNIRIDTQGKFWLTKNTAGGGVQFRNCDTALDITASEIWIYYSFFSGQCYFRGNFNVTGDSPVKITNEHGNIFDFRSNREIQYIGDGLSIYNSEKLTKNDTSSTNLKPCTTAQLKDAEYLYSIGFPIRTAEEPDYTLERGDIFTGNSTDDMRTVRTVNYIPLTTAQEAITVSATFTKEKETISEIRIICYSDTEISARNATAFRYGSNSVTLNHLNYGDASRKKINFFRVKFQTAYAYIFPEDVEITVTGNNYTWYIDQNGYPHGDNMPYAPARKPIVSPVPQNDYIRVYDKGTFQDGFDNNGLAVLEPISCTVTENFNAGWTVTLEHPIDREQKWKYLKEFNILKVLEQLFVIRKTEHLWTGNSGKVVAYAEHIFYHLNDRWIYKGADIYAESGYWLVKSILEHSDTKYQSGQTVYKFNFYSDLTSENIGFDMPSIAYYKWNPVTSGMTPIEMLLGSDGFTANFGGDLYRDNFYFSINKKMEHAVYDSFDIYVGLNLRGIRRTVDTSALCTHFTASDKFGSAVSVFWNVHGGVPHHIVRSQEFSFGENYTSSNMNVLGYEAKKYFGLHKEPQIDITVDLEDVKKNPEYSEFANNPRYKVGDRGRIYDERLGISLDAFISHTVKDGITGKNLEITFSSTSGFTNMGDYDINIEETPAVPPESPDIPEEISD